MGWWFFTLISLFDVEFLWIDVKTDFFLENVVKKEEKLWINMHNYFSKECVVENEVGENGSLKNMYQTRAKLYLLNMSNWSYYTCFSFEIVTTQASVLQVVVSYVCLRSICSFTLHEFLFHLPGFEFKTSTFEFESWDTW